MMAALGRTVVSVVSFRVGDRGEGGRHTRIFRLMHVMQPLLGPPTLTMAAYLEQQYEIGRKLPCQ